MVRIGAVGEGELGRFVDLLRAPDALLAEGYLQDRVEAGDTMVSIFQDLLTPAARRLGSLWEDDDCDFVEVTLACARLQKAVRRLGALFGAAGGGGHWRGRALVCGVAGDQHTLGPILVAETLAREGFGVSLGSPFARDPSSGRFEVVAISMASSDHWMETRARIVRLRRRHPGARILLGGGAVVRHPEMARTAGADAWALDVEGLLDIVRIPVEA